MKITKEILLNYYLQHSNKDTQIYFNLSKVELLSLLKKYDINIHSKQENISYTLLNKSKYLVFLVL